MPFGLYVDDENTIYVADSDNDRVLAWSLNTTSGQVIAGGNGKGDTLNQLFKPTDVIMDRSTNELLICDRGNRRVVRWPHRDGLHGDILLSNIDCFGLTMDDRWFLYVTIIDKAEIRRFKLGESHGTVVAGGNGEGERLDQFNGPAYLYVDRDYSLYVSDSSNHRVVKWVKGAKEGEVVAGGHGPGSDFKQLSHPFGVLVDKMGTVYVADQVTPLRGTDVPLMQQARWSDNGTTVAGGHGNGEQLHQLNMPIGLYVDDDNTIYVADSVNHRVLAWSPNATTGQVVAGGNGKGSALNQLVEPRDVIMDRSTNKLLICDRGNRRVVSWPHRDGLRGDIVLSSIACFGLTMDDRWFLYVTITDTAEVLRFKLGESHGTVVAGGNGIGARLDQFNQPTFLYVDQDYSLYVSDMQNHRVVKWLEDAKQGEVVAGGNGAGIVNNN
ncbi:unnamed protein product [Rotaria sordida]|uniref:Uncharacterized protein n=1 Tax=Rotaria sordida TaxID=392033 RepID=A0A815CV57_9BILA|nr:unnamed protein product [Rotaria sordida]CAF1568479.1 unnamed protein product [Rotaria sordida]